MQIIDHTMKLNYSGLTLPLISLNCNENILKALTAIGYLISAGIVMILANSNFSCTNVSFKGASRVKNVVNLASLSLFNITMGVKSTCTIFGSVDNTGSMIFQHTYFRVKQRPPHFYSFKKNRTFRPPILQGKWGFALGINWLTCCSTQLRRFRVFMREFYWGLKYPHLLNLVLPQYLSNILLGAVPPWKVWWWFVYCKSGLIIESILQMVFKTLHHYLQY